MTQPLNMLITSIIFLSVLSKTSAISCFYCSSANNSACIDPTQYDDEMRSRIIPIIECETAIPAYEDIRFFCRKIVQTIYLSHQKTELRITRGCGWVPHEKECYRNDHSQHSETVCQCFSNHCNSADKMDSLSATIFVLLSACLYFYR